MKPGESVAVFGCGGLGVSAIKLALALGASEVIGVDISEEKLEIAGQLGARPVPTKLAHRIEADIALDLVGIPQTMEAAVGCLTVGGRAVAVGIGSEPMALNAFHDLAVKEAEILGASDHLSSEIDELIQMVDEGRLDLSDVVLEKVPLEADAVNDALDRLDAYRAPIRTVIEP